MSVREGVRAFLHADSAYMALLTGGLYPDPTLGDAAEQRISRDGTPAAFDGFGDLKPCGMVIEDGTTQAGPLRHSAQTFLRVLHFQQSGRDVVEAADRQAYALLQGARFTIDGQYCRFRFAGTSQSNLTDPTLRDAALSWSRWQITRLLA